jgi:hypothetical protein
MVVLAFIVSHRRDRKYKEMKETPVAYPNVKVSAHLNLEGLEIENK